MSSEIIPIAHVQAAGAWFHGEALEILEQAGVVRHDTPKPYFVFDIDVPPDRIEKFREHIQTSMEPDTAAALLTFLESMDWEASFLYLG